MVGSQSIKDGAVTATAPDGPSLVDWDRPGSLSIVVQGGLFQGNLVETANHCRHWRELFPQAEVILAISVTDVIGGRRENGLLADVKLVSKHVEDGHLQFALQIILDSCDKVVLSEAALPLPPIKNDSPKLNNMNLQLAAAKQGLAHTSGAYVLRIRSDMVFLDRSFLQQYIEGCFLARGSVAVFKQRVMISWLYTLNPFTVERMPLHFSDWFHFGLTDDVRQIWSAPSISLRDSMYFRTRKHAPGSNTRERQFNIRLAVEQHIIYHCFKQSRPDLTLEYNNDTTSVDLSLDILVDNFVICDLARAHCVFEKYASEFVDKSKEIHCITRDDWVAMVSARRVDYRTTLAHKIKAAASDPSLPIDPSFPRIYAAGRLSTRNGQFVGDDIVSTSSNGLLFHGPYATLEKGRYVATVNVSKLEGAGVITLRITLEGGKKLAAKRWLLVGPGAHPDIRIPFDIGASAKRVELLFTMNGKLAVSVSSITIAERDPKESALGWPVLRARLRH